MLVVDELNAVADEDAIGNPHSLADEGGALDLAARSDNHAALDLDERPDPRVVPDRTSVEVGEAPHDDPLPESAVVDQSVRGIVAGPVGHRAKASESGAALAGETIDAPARIRQLTETIRGLESWGSDR